MGICCTGHIDIKTDSEAEMFMREVLMNLKLRSIHYSELENLYADKCRIYLNKLLLEGKDLNCLSKGFLFNYFKKDLYDTNHTDNQLHVFQEKLFSSNWNEIVNCDPYLFFFTYCLSITCGEKDNSIIKILQESETLTYESFKKFLYMYLEHNLLTYTKLINIVLKENKEFYMNNLVTINNREFNEQFIRECSELELNYFTFKKVQKYAEFLIFKMEKVLLYRLKNSNIKNSTIINQEDITDYLAKCPFILDVIYLRHNFYEFAK